MNYAVMAIYENGVLRPLTPLKLPEHSRVQLQVQLVIVPDSSTRRQKVRAALVAAGLSLSTSEPLSNFVPLTPEQRQELAQRFSPPTSRPLSTLIIEEREGR